MRSIPSLLLAVLLVCALCAGCGNPAAPEEADRPDLSGIYTDKQGTADVYSELELELQDDGTYRAAVGIYRIAGLEGTAVWQDGTLHFTSGEPAVEGNITVSDGRAELVITASEQAYISPGDVYAFPDGAPDSAPRPEG